MSKQLDDSRADTRPAARQYLQAQALQLAHDIVRDGRPAEKIRVLEGLGEVLGREVDPGPRVVVQIGIKASDVTIEGLSPLTLPARLDEAVVTVERVPQRQLSGAESQETLLGGWTVRR